MSSLTNAGQSVTQAGVPMEIAAYRTREHRAVREGGQRIIAAQGAAHLAADVVAGTAGVITASDIVWLNRVASHAEAPIAKGAAMLVQRKIGDLAERGKSVTAACRLHGYRLAGQA